MHSALIDERGYIMENMTQKEVSLRKENDSLKEELASLKTLIEMRVTQCASKEKENYELKAKIKFLEGQIEAFQYMMNCRR